MKKQNRKSQISKIASLSIATLLIITSIVVTTSANEEPEMQILGKDGYTLEIQDTNNEPGTTGHVIEVSGSWPEEIFRIMIRLEYGTTLANGDINITHLTLDGCIDEDPVMFTKIITNDGTTGNVLVLIDFGEWPFTPGEGIAAGSGRLFNIIVDIAETAEDQEVDFTKGDPAHYKTYPNNQQDIAVTPGILTISSPNKSPEIPATPSGPTQGTVGLEYDFTVNTIDPDEDDIYYRGF